MEVVSPSQNVRRCLEITGMMTPQRSKHGWFFKLLNIYYLFCISYATGGGFAYFFLSKEEITNKFSSVQIGSTCLKALVKQMNAKFCQNELQELLTNYDDTWKQFYADPLNKIFLDPICAKSRRLFLIVQGIQVMVLGTLWATSLIMHFAFHVSVLPEQILSPFDQDRWFIWALIFQFPICMCPFFTNSYHMYLMVSLSKQLVGYMKIFQRILVDGEITRNTVKLHQSIIRIFKMTNDLFSWVLYFETTSVVIECAFSAFVVYKTYSDRKGYDAVPSVIVNVLFCYFTPYVVCYCGMIVTKESERVFRAAYAGRWYTHSIESRKKLTMLLLGSLHPLCYHYRRLANFNMQLFLAIVQGSFTFINALLCLERTHKK